MDNAKYFSKRTEVKGCPTRPSDTFRYKIEVYAVLWFRFTSLHCIKSVLRSGISTILDYIALFDMWFHALLQKAGVGDKIEPLFVSDGTEFLVTVAYHLLH